LRREITVAYPITLSLYDPIELNLKQLPKHLLIIGSIPVYK